MELDFLNYCLYDGKLCSFPHQKNMKDIFHLQTQLLKRVATLVHLSVSVQDDRSSITHVDSIWKHLCN